MRVFLIKRVCPHRPSSVASGDGAEDHCAVRQQGRPQAAHHQRLPCGGHPAMVGEVGRDQERLIFFARAIMNDALELFKDTVSLGDVSCPSPDSSYLLLLRHAHTHTHTYTHTHSCYLSLTHSLLHSLTHTHTHTQTLPHTCTPTRQLPAGTLSPTGSTTCKLSSAPTAARASPPRTRTAMRTTGDCISRRHRRGAAGRAERSMASHKTCLLYVWRSLH